jgi:aspartate/glutamate/glutamine transport system permease protein
MPSDAAAQVGLEALKFLLQGYKMTILLTLAATLPTLALGTLVGMMRVIPSRFGRILGTIYVEFFRNIPLLIVLFFVYHGLPRAGLTFSAFNCALIAISVYTAAFVAEVVRAGIQAIHKGQLEAARSLGLSYIQMMRFVVLPQAFSITVPPLGNIFIAMLKNTSLASTIAVAELLYQAEVLDSRTFRTFEIFITVGILYLTLTLPLGALVNGLERRLAPKGR